MFAGTAALHIPVDNLPRVTCLVLDSLAHVSHVAPHEIVFAVQHGELMRDFREVLARLRAYQTKFEGLLASARKKAARGHVPPPGPATRLRELHGFGENPGNLRMFVYAPKQLPPKPPLVIALHG